MVPAAVILVVLVVVLSISGLLLLRSWGSEQSRHEARLHDPHTSTVAFAVPNGIDPVVLELELSRHGFDSVIDRVGDSECLLVECAKPERARLRSVIEAVHLREYDGSDLRLEHVVFEDER